VPNAALRGRLLDSFLPSDLVPNEGTLSFADWLAVSSARGGPAIGTGLVAFLLAAMIAAFVWFLSSTGADTPEDQRAPRERRVARPTGEILSPAQF